MERISNEEIQTVFTANTRQLETAIIRFGNQLEAAALKQQRTMDRTNRRIARSADRLNRDLRRALAGAAFAVAGRDIVKFGDDYVDMSNKVKAASQVSGLEGRSLEGLSEYAARARAQLEPFVDLYSRVLRSSKGYIESEQEVADVTLTIARAFEAGGASAQEYQAGLIQIGQALGSGFLQGDELRSLRENAPLVAQAIANEFGVSIGKLKELGAEGELTTARVVRALQNQKAAIDDAFDATNARGTNEAARAFDRFTLAVGRFVAESGAVNDASVLIAGGLDFVSENLETLTDAVLIGGAALAGFMGASAAATIVSGLSAATTGTKGFTKALKVLELVSKTLGGPLVIGATIAAGAVAYLALRGTEAERAFSELDETLKQFDKTTETIASDQERLKTLNLDIAEAIKAQKTEIEATKRADLAAVAARISANKQLLGVLQAQAAQELSDLDDKLKPFQGDRVPNISRAPLNTSSLESPEDFARKTIRRGSVREADGSQITDVARANERYNEVLEEQFQRIVRLQDAREDKTLTERESALVNVYIEQNELLERQRKLKERVRVVKNGSGLAPLTDFRDILDPRPSADADDDDKSKKAKKDPFASVLEDLRDENEQTFSTERELIQKTLDLRLEAIEKAKIKDSERAELRIQAEELYSDAIGRVRAEESAFEDERAKASKEQADREIELVNDMLSARDFAAGRILAVINSEFDARAAQYEAEIENAERRNIALIALEEERELVIAQVREEALSRAREFSSDDYTAIEIERIEQEASARIDAIRGSYDDEIALHQEAQDQIVEIQRSAAEQIEELQGERLRNYVDETAGIFGSLASIIEDAGGKTSSAYKTLIAIERAFTFASLSMQIAQGIGKAISLGFPQNIPVIAAVTAQGAQALSILSSAKGFQSGGYTGGGGDSDARGVVHANEWVVNAPTLRYYGLEAMEALHKRKIPIAALRGYQRGGYVGTPPPAIRRAADRYTRPVNTPQPLPRASQITNLTLEGANIQLTGTGSEITLEDVKRTVQESQDRTVKAILPLVANDMRKGGGPVSGALEATYGVGRNGR